MKTFRELLEAWHNDAMERNGNPKTAGFTAHLRHLKDLADKLHNSTAAHLNGHDSEAISEYTEHDKHDNFAKSAHINKPLIRGEQINPEHIHMHEAIMDNAAPAKHEVHLWSGTGADFGELAKKSKDGILHSPAHISATHDAKVARNFANDKYDTRKIHVVHIHVKPHDKVLHVSKHSHHEFEFETIIPAGTKLKYHGSTDHGQDDGMTRRLHEHHFTIHSQD